MAFAILETDGAVATLTVNNPKALNALSPAVLTDMEACIDSIDLDTIRCLIITGAGKSFVAGADITAMVHMNKADASAYSKQGNDLFLKIEALPIPVIAAINGFALGGGCELAMSCDIRICSEKAIFGQPEVQLGITPGYGGTQRMARLVGAGIAKELIYTARNMMPDEALRVGLVNAVYAPDELMPAAQKMAKKIAKNAPLAVSLAKSMIADGIDLNIADAVAMESSRFGGVFEGHDQVEGMTAFIEKRKPTFTKN